MSGTRLLSRKAPATDAAIEPALLIAAHGERGGAGGDWLVHALCRQLRGTDRYRGVEVFFTGKEPSLKAVLGRLSPGPVSIYPLFMSDGYFVNRAIPQAIRDCSDHAGKYEFNILTPVGLHPRLPSLIADIVQETAQSEGLHGEPFSLLLVAHGSKYGSASHNATAKVAEAIAQGNGSPDISLAFLEETPFLDNQLKAIAGPAIAVGLFIGEGMHGAEDLPGAITRSGRDDIVLTMPLARWPALAELIYSDLDEQAGAAIESLHAAE